MRKRYECDRRSRKDGNARRKKDARAWLDGYKATIACVRCGESHPACLQFHHPEGTKEVDTKGRQGTRNIAAMVHAGLSLKRIKANIEECEVLCANCHFKLHFDTALLAHPPSGCAIPFPQLELIPQ
jgi:hypothetical protein